MILSQEELLKRVLDTKALSIWNREKGPVFWYTIGVPGPFFLNTEYLLGKEFSTELVAKITSILEQSPVSATRAEQIRKTVMDAYNGSQVFKDLIETMIAKTDETLAPDSYTVVSGGERRDWLFSIPFAEEKKLRHIYIFKDKSTYCDSPLGPDEKALHVADLINNAASYVEKWLPALEQAKIAIDTTLCVDTRGNVGITKLKERKINILALFHLDLPFFEKLKTIGLVDQATYDELALFYETEPGWAEKYLIGREDLFKVEKDNTKTIERTKSFFTKDPWNLRTKHPEFFEKMRRQIEQ